MKRILLILLFAISLQGAFSMQVSAQGCPTAWVQYCATCGDKTYPGMHDCQVFAPFLSICKVPNWKCAAPNSPSETKPPKCDCGQEPSSGQPSGGGPISFATGNTFIIENDISLPGLGGGLSLIRQWNSMWPSADSAYQIGMFGPNWRSTYEEQVFVGSVPLLKETVKNKG